MLELQIGRHRVRVIGVEDLLVDRLNRTLHWQDEAARKAVLMVLAGRHARTIDWSYLERRARAEGVYDALQAARREVERSLEP